VDVFKIVLKGGHVYTVHQSLIYWWLSRSYFQLAVVKRLSDRSRCGQVAVVNVWTVRWDNKKWLLLERGPLVEVQL